MIRGIGIDIVDAGRIRRLVEGEELRFLEKVFTRTEIAYCNAKQNRYQHFAARFAAKEAFGYLDAPIERIAAPDIPVPFSPALECHYIPQKEDIVTTVKRMVS